MFLLDEFQKRRHVRSAEMVYRFQSGKHAHLTQSLEMVFANVLSKKTIKSSSKQRDVDGIMKLIKQYCSRCGALTNMVVRKSNLWKN